jgi:hypothetical protein
MNNATTGGEVRLPPRWAARLLGSSINKIDRFRRRIYPPQLQVLEMIDGLKLAHALSVATRLGVPDQLAMGSRTVEEIATACGANANALYRIMRALATKGVFEETSDGRFRLTPTAEILRSDVPGSLRAWVSLLDVNWQVWGELGYTVRTGDPAYRRVYGRGPHDYHLENPEIAALFDEAMASFTHFAAKAVASFYNFSRIKSVVDVGGGNGTLLVELLRHYPHLQGCLFEGPWVVDRGRATIAAAGMSNRCKVVAGDFLQSIPVSGDVFVMKNVVHDWDDDRAVVLLKNVRNAMGDDARLLIMECVIPEGNEAFSGKLLDLTMLVSTGGRERKMPEYDAILREAGLTRKRVIETPLPYSLIEAVPAAASAAQADQPAASGNDVRQLSVR